MAVKRSEGISPEVDLRECTLHSPLQKGKQGRTQSGFETQRRRHLNPKQGYQWLQKGLVFAIFFKEAYFTG